MRKTFEQHPITKEGALAKKGSFWGKWSDRWFVLRGPYLAEYKQQPDKEVKPLALYNLPLHTVRGAEGLTGLPLTLGVFGKKQKHTIFLKSTNKVDFNDWVHQLSTQSKEGAAVGSWKTTDKAIEAFSKKDCVVCATDKGIVIAINSVMEKEFGWKKEELVGKPITTFMVKSLGPVHEAYMQRYINSGERRLIGKARQLKGAIKKDGTPVTVDLSLGEVFEGDQRRFIATMRVLNDNDDEGTEDPTSENDLSSWSESPATTYQSDDEDDSVEEEVEKFEGNLDMYVRSMKDNILADFKEVAQQLGRANDEIEGMKGEMVQSKRRLVRMEIGAEAMRKILLTDWGESESRSLGSLGLGGSEAKHHMTKPSPEATLAVKAKSVDRLPIRLGPRFCFVETLKQMITKEVSTTRSATLLFRTDNSTTSLMTAFSASMGLEYLENTLGFLVRHLMQGKMFEKESSSNPGSLSARRGGGGGSKKKRVGFEINPALIPPHEKRSRNIRNLINHCNIFLRAILLSQMHCPTEMREIASHIVNEVKRKFPAKKEKKHLIAVGGWMFLRFFCPAIIFPAQFGLVIPEDLRMIELTPTNSSDNNTTTTTTTTTTSSTNLESSSGGCPVHPLSPSSQSRPSVLHHRGLVLISKFLQNLANGVEFHAEYDRELNELIKEKTPAVVEFLTEISRTPSHAWNGATEASNGSLDGAPKGN